MSIHFKRLPIIRHVRWLYAQWKFQHWWNKLGRHLGLGPNQSDLDYLEAIWRGDR
jgi:hypothetical protein